MTGILLSRRRAPSSLGYWPSCPLLFSAVAFSPLCRALLRGVDDVLTGDGIVGSGAVEELYAQLDNEVAALQQVGTKKVDTPPAAAGSVTGGGEHKQKNKQSFAANERRDGGLKSKDDTHEAVEARTKLNDLSDDSNSELGKLGDLKLFGGGKKRKVDKKETEEEEEKEGKDEAQVKQEKRSKSKGGRSIPDAGNDLDLSGVDIYDHDHDDKILSKLTVERLPKVEPGDVSGVGETKWRARRSIPDSGSPILVTGFDIYDHPHDDETVIGDSSAGTAKKSQAHVGDTKSKAGARHIPSARSIPSPGEDTRGFDIYDHPHDDETASNGQKSEEVKIGDSSGGSAKDLEDGADSESQDPESKLDKIMDALTQTGDGLQAHDVKQKKKHKPTLKAAPVAVSDINRLLGKQNDMADGDDQQKVKKGEKKQSRKKTQKSTASVTDDLASEADAMETLGVSISEGVGDSDGDEQQKVKKERKTRSRKKATKSAASDTDELASDADALEELRASLSEGVGDSDTLHHSALIPPATHEASQIPKTTGAHSAIMDKLEHMGDDSNMFSGLKMR